MDTTTVILTFIGAFAGAVFAPFGEYLFDRFLGRQTNKVVAGFVLLCVANAFWTIIAFLFNWGDLLIGFWLISALYVVSIMIFISAFRAFNQSELRVTSLALYRSLRWLLLGNMIWVLADFAGHAVDYFQFDEVSGRALLSCLLFLSMTFFFLGALTLRSDVNSKGDGV